MGDSRRFIETSKFIQRNYHSNLNILDVAGGSGELSKILSSLGYHTTIIDPKLTISKMDCRKYKIQTIKKLFDMSFDISEYDVIVGLHPDEATEIIIKRCTSFKKPFVVIPCCVIPQFSNSKFNSNSWISHLKHLSSDVLECQLPFTGKNIVLYKSTYRR